VSATANAAINKRSEARVALKILFIDWALRDELATQFQRGLQALHVLCVGNFDHSKLRQMLGEVLYFKQRETASVETLDEFCERDFGGVGFRVEFGLRENRAAEVDAIRPADQPALAPDFDGMGLAEPVHGGI